jgi:hypothetical protein
LEYATLKTRINAPPDAILYHRPADQPSLSCGIPWQDSGVPSAFIGIWFDPNLAAPTGSKRMPQYYSDGVYSLRSCPKDCASTAALPCSFLLAARLWASIPRRRVRTCMVARFKSLGYAGGSGANGWRYIVLKGLPFAVGSSAGVHKPLPNS